MAVPPPVLPYFLVLSRPFLFAPSSLAKVFGHGLFEQGGHVVWDLQTITLGYREGIPRTEMEKLLIRYLNFSFLERASERAGSILRAEDIYYPEEKGRRERASERAANVDGAKC